MKSKNRKANPLYAFLIHTLFPVNLKLVQLLIIFQMVSLFLPNLSKSQEMIWPIDYYKIISSSFGEPRLGRFSLWC